MRTLLYMQLGYFFTNIEQSPILPMPTRDQLPAQCVPWLGHVRGYKEP